jgi:hypothetical protein
MFPFKYGGIREGGRARSPPFLPYSSIHSLTPSLPSSLSHSLAHSLTHSLTWSSSERSKIWKGTQPFAEPLFLLSLSPTIKIGSLAPTPSQALATCKRCRTAWARTARSASPSPMGPSKTQALITLGAGEMSLLPSAPTHSLERRSLVRVALITLSLVLGKSIHS